MKLEKINLVLIIIIMLFQIYIAFILPNQEKKKINKCYDIAQSLKRDWQEANNEYTITNDIIFDFQTAMTVCLANKLY